MALIDVTQLLHDPDFIDPVSIVTRVPTVNTFGENAIVETTADTFGSVQAASGKDLKRLPEALQLADVSSFWIQGVIQASATGQYASILVFKGKRYQVIHVDDWSNFGAGYCKGFCVAELPS